MRPARIKQSQPLLQGSAGRCSQSYADETGRRDLYRKALSRLQSNYSEVAQRRASHKSQTDSGTHESAVPGRGATRAKHIQASSGTLQIPISSQWPDHSTASSCMEHRYHIYSTSKWLRIPGGSNRLVQPISAVLSPLKQLGNQLLSGGLRRSDPTLWSAANLQHRPRGAIHFPRVCECRAGEKYSVQHGWARASARQYLCRALMEICKI